VRKKWKPAQDALKKVANDPLVQAAYPCKHEHLKFKEWGRELHCIDCNRRWLLQLKGQDTPDYGTVNRALSDLDTRHAPYVSPRFVKE
jgi:hypothetical protein